MSPPQKRPPQNSRFSAKKQEKRKPGHPADVPVDRQNGFAEFSAKAENEGKLFLTAACTWTKTLFRLQVWNLFALGEQIMRAADCKNWRKSPKGIFDNLKPGHPADVPAEDYLWSPKRGRATRLYRSMVRAETTVPFSRFRGATQSMTKVVTLDTPPRISLPMAMMLSRGRP